MATIDDRYVCAAFKPATCASSSSMRRWATAASAVEMEAFGSAANVHLVDRLDEFGRGASQHELHMTFSIR